MDPEVIALNRVVSIKYSVLFGKSKRNPQALIESGDKLNAMISLYTKQLRLRTRKTDVEFQKIDSSSLKTLGIVIPEF